MIENNSVYIICKPINNCNQNCEYCFDKKFHDKNAKPIDKEILYDFFTKIVEEFEFVEWCWHGGEPLLVGPEWFEEVMFNLNKIREKHIRQARFYMQSNCTLWTNEWSELCARYNVKISSSYDINTKFRSYNYTENDAVRSMNVVITKDNIDKLIDIYKDFSAKNIDLNYIFPYETGEYKLEDVLGNTEYAIKKYLEFLDFYLTNQECRSAERSANSWINIANGNCGLSCVHTRCIKENILVLLNDGTLWKCDNTSNPMFKVGDAKNFDKFYNLDFSGLSAYTQTPKECDACEYRQTCGFGCINCRMHTDGPEHPYSFHCALTKNIIPFLFPKINNLQPKDMFALSFQAKQVLIGGFYLPESIMERLWKQYLLIFPTNTDIL